MTVHSSRAGSPDTAVTFINVFEVDAGDAEAVAAQWERRGELMRDKPGFLGSRLHRARSSDSRFQLVNVAHWESQEAWEAATADPAFQRGTQEARDDAAKPITVSPALYDVAVDLTPLPQSETPG